MFSPYYDANTSPPVVLLSNFGFIKNVRCHRNPINSRSIIIVSTILWRSRVTFNMHTRGGLDHIILNYYHSGRLHA